jgi:DNA-directed RNA polymerase subunit RPC12/RpoP
MKMRIPYLLLKQLPMWDYVCPKCKREVKQKSHKCPYCGENYGVPLRVPPKYLKDSKALEDYVHKHIFPKVSAKQREYLAKFFTTIFAHGFDCGSFTCDDLGYGGWTGTEQESGTIVVSSDYAHHGSYSAKASITATNGYASCNKDITSQTTIYVRVYVYISAGTFASGVQVTFIIIRDVPDGISQCYVGVANANRQLWLRYRHSATNYDVYSSTTLSTNTWYCIELKYVKSTTAGEYRVWLNGNEVTDLTQTGKNTDADVTRVRVGPRYTSRISDFVGYFDCVVVADTYIGPEVPPKPKGSIVIHAKLAGVI